MELPLVSIIIPTFNRSHIIIETLESVLMQTYSNWECIVVDDGSKDNTNGIVERYCQRDNRFQYHRRPINRPKGANACRNYGFEISAGKYVNFFDDDDLMLENFIELKLNTIEGSKYDFVFSKTVNFLENGIEFPMFEGDNNEKLVTINNFILGIITWCTPDFFATKSCLEGIYFNEMLKSGQEYNYFIKILMYTQNGLFTNNILTKRRIHNHSIQEEQKCNEEKYRLNKYIVYVVTYEEILLSADRTALNQLLNLAMSKAFDIILNNEKLPNLRFLLRAVLKQKGFFKMNVYVISLIFARFFNKGYSLMNYCRR
tara:strand:+ start:4677 stop:5621 length:945 start_codon:yes stop_codon:yes gene_type:complete